MFCAWENNEEAFDFTLIKYNKNHKRNGKYNNQIKINKITKQSDIWKFCKIFFTKTRLETNRLGEIEIDSIEIEK